MTKGGASVGELDEMTSNFSVPHLDLSITIANNHSLFLLYFHLQFKWLCIKCSVQSMALGDFYLECHFILLSLILLPVE